MRHLFLLSLLSLALAASAPAADNLVSGLPVFFDPAPNYVPCTDPEDSRQLTDGVVSSGNGLLWVQKEAVGWVHPRQPVFLSVDLGSEKRIGSVSIHSAAGHAGVYWPAAIGVFLSDDGKSWAFAGEVISRSIASGLPEPMSYSEHRFVLENINTPARHVAFCVSRGGSGFFITDEIEIIEAGPNAAPGQTSVVGDLAAVREFILRDPEAYLIPRRLELDRQRIARIVETSALSAPAKQALADELGKVTAKIRKEPVEVPPGFQTVIPINAAQGQLLSLHGKILQQQGYPPLLLTKTHRYAHLGWLETPEKREQAPIRLDYRQMSGETRADLFLATNASPDPVEIAIELDAPAGAIELSYCPWTDTPQLEPVATALLPAKKEANTWRVTIPAGTTTKIWASLDGSRLPPGRHQYKGTVTDGRGASVEVSASAEISPVKVGPPTLHLGMWDELNGKGSYAIHPRNAEAAIRLMRSHGVDSPWATPRVLPMPQVGDFDAEDRLLPGKPDFSTFDAWLEQWPNARRYMVFLNVSKSIGGVGMDSPRFAPRVEQWAAAAWQHLESRGLQPGQVFLLLVDEPKTDEQDQRLLAWSRPIKNAAPQLQIWSDPVWQDPHASAHPAAFELPDVLSPNAGTLAKGGAKTLAFYRAKQADGKPLEIYACSALAPHSDPNRYFRMLPWIGWPLRVQGVGYWAFGDTGGLEDCWNAYGSARGIWYTPAFIGKTDATDTLHWQAVREGLLDHQYLSRLEEALPAIADPRLQQEARQLLGDEAVQALLMGWTHLESASWKGSAGQENPDLHRLKILTLLEKLPPGAKTVSRKTHRDIL